jgi:hypothetical protein
MISIVDESIEERDEAEVELRGEIAKWRGEREELIRRRDA